MKNKLLVRIFSFIMAFAVTAVIGFSGSKFYATGSSSVGNMKVMVPAYFEPTTYWSRLAAQAAKMPGRLYAVANPDSGPGSAKDSSYSTGINTVRSNSGKILGYVATTYSNKSEADAKAEIDKWFSWYSVDGIFLDEMQSEAGHEQYYQDLYNYIKSKSSSALVVGNPGSNTIESYLYYNGSRVADVLCIYENSTGLNNFTQSSWESNYSPDNFYVLPYNTSSSSWQSTVNRAASVNCGWIYCTDDNLPNPWDTLPSYFEQMCDYIEGSTDGSLNISNVESSSLTNSGAAITWTTDNASDSRVDYGTDASYGWAASSSSKVTSHSITLTGLSPNTTYHYKVTSKDANNNSAVSADNTFTTLGSSTITIDGSFSDWSGISAFATDPQDAGGGSGDVKALAVASANNNLYAKLDVYGTFSMSTVNILYLDTDNVSTTGYYGGGWPQFGADYRIVYSNYFIPPKLQQFSGSDQGDDQWTDVAALSGAYSGSSAEIAIPYNTMNLTSGQTVKLMFRASEDAAPDFWRSSQPTYTLN